MWFGSGGSRGHAGVSGRAPWSNLMRKGALRERGSRSQSDNRSSLRVGEPRTFWSRLELEKSDKSE